jgi:hypothetical protein
MKGKYAPRWASAHETIAASSASSLITTVGSNVGHFMYSTYAQR